MKLLLIPALLLLTLAAACPVSSIHSHLLLSPNEQFILGGDQPGAFRVAAHNTGPVPVEIRERLSTGQLLRRAQLAAGERGRLLFSPKSTALLRNNSGEQAVLELDITGSKPQRMMMGPAGGDGRLGPAK